MAFSEMTRLVSNSKDLTDESPKIHFENIDTFAPYVHRKSSSNLEFRTILFLSRLVFKLLVNLRSFWYLFKKDPDVLLARLVKQFLNYLVDKVSN